MFDRARSGVALLLSALFATGLQAQNANGDWAKTLEEISSGVVSIRVDITRAFDTAWNLSTQATGFVVDAEQGLILTNRHVVTPAPVRAEALFRNQEELDLVPVYRDPVHDFGLYRYDPRDLIYIEPTELALYPQGAQIGREIRVVGNDAGEQLSILAGTIARLDRQAPDYGTGKYNDFNTWYIQAASGTSGGSSGSPVIDIEGRVVALNAGANTQAASSFFLPLDRVKRALELIQRGEPVTRGTLETVFVQRPYDELRRLGLQETTEKLVREKFPGRTGLLVVDKIIPDGTADGVLEVGDILVSLEGELLTDFVSLEEVLDDSAGADIRVTVERNGSPMDLDLRVTDLHSVTPSEYIQFGDAAVNQLSYQLARSLNRPIRGIYVANPGYLFSAAAIPRGSVIVEINGTAVNDLDDLESVLSGLADRERARVRFFTFEDPGSSKLRIVRMDRRWFPAARCKRDDDTGVWPCRNLAEGPAAEPPDGGSARFTRQRERRVREISQSLVVVNFDMPYTVSGVSERHYYGTGVVVDADRGLVVVDRNTVPESMGDVQITIAGSLTVPGRVEYIHPLHNLAVVSYDTDLVGDTPVRSARLDTRMAEPGDDVLVVGLRSDNKLVYRETSVASIEPVSFPLSRTVRFRETNLDTLALVNGPDDIDGVILGEDGKVVSLWSSFAFQGTGELSQVNKGVPAELVQEVLDLARDGKPLYSLEAELRQLPLSAARQYGLPQSWVDRMESHDPDRRQVLTVVRTTAGAPSDSLLRPGDLLLAIDDQPVTRFREVEQAAGRPGVQISLWRDGQQKDLSVATVPLDGRGVQRAVIWAGALLQPPYRDMAAQRGILPSGVYVAFFNYGTPASRYGLFAGRRIVQVDGQDTPDLDSFIQAVTGRTDRAPVRLTTVTWNNVVEVLTLKLDRTYWPAYEVFNSPTGWQRRELE